MRINKFDNQTFNNVEKSKLVPYLRPKLDILFVGLNPAKGSSDNGHYFSVNQAFWNQLFEAGLVLKSIDKIVADNIVFGNNKYNFNGWNYGITDLVTTIAESDSSKIKPTYQDCENIISEIKKYKPRAVILLHGKVLSNICSYLAIATPKANTGKMGYLIKGYNSMFYNIAFPHGNSIPSSVKVNRYKELKKELIKSN